MGIYCRDWAEQAEKDTAKGILGKSDTAFNQQIADAIKVQVATLYPNNTIVEAKWVGAEAYDDKGDVKVFLDNGTEVPVELKVSFKGGSGTKANPSQALFHKKIDRSIDGYSDFDKKAGYLNQRYNLVEDKIGRKIESNADWGRVLRELRSTQPEILEHIAEITSPGQSQYAEYAATELNKHLDQVNTLVDDILSGDNTTSEFSADSELMYCVVKHYESAKQTVEFYDFSQMDSVVTKVVSSGQSIKMLNKHNNVILRFSVTWKNICQGGQTPCFTVFVGDAFK
jgi:hypothetical protein